MPMSHDSESYIFPADCTNATLCYALGYSHCVWWRYRNTVRVTAWHGLGGEGMGFGNITGVINIGQCAPEFCILTLARCNSHSLSRYVQIPHANSCLELRRTWQDNVRGASPPPLLCRTCQKATSKPRNQYQARNGIWGISAGLPSSIWRHTQVRFPF